MTRWLLSGEELRLQEKTLFDRKPATVVITETRIFIDCDGRVAAEFPLPNLKFKRSKTTTALPDSNTVVKLRMFDDQNRLADIAFKGVTSETILARVLEVAKAAQKELQSRLVDPLIHRLPPQLDLPPEDPRHRLITEDRVVADMYRLLVESETISADEFWENFRLDLAPRESDPIITRSAFESEKLSKSPTEFRFRMSKTTIAQIFAKQPAIQEQYRKWVSDHSSPGFSDSISPEQEQEFWETYLRGSASRNPDDREIFDDLSRQKRESSMKLDFIEVSRSRDQVDDLPPAFKETISLLNLNSELTLSQAEERESIPEENEEDESGFFFVPQRKVVGEHNPALSDCSVFFLDEVTQYYENFSQLPEAPDISGDDAWAVLAEMSENSEAEFNIEKLKTDDKIIGGHLSRLRKHKMEQQILLFHFWNNVENEDELSRQKAIRLLEKLTDLKRICWNEVRGIASPVIGRLLLPLYRELNDAFTKVPGMKE
jgi:hypothetical protein